MSSCCGPVRDEISRASVSLVSSAGVPGADMLAIPAGVYQVGGEGSQCITADGEGPLRDIYIDGFLMDATAVTTQQFAGFVEHTGYVTDAEVFAWSFVFAGLLPPGTACLEQAPNATPWWRAVPGASWRSPSGPASSYADCLDHPVVHVSWNDAQAYAQWAGKKLPSEAQWEVAARGRSAGQIFPWGDVLEADGKHRCNVWQGVFPSVNSAEDGFMGTAPARSFEPNGYGLFNMLGNVWEWCSDWWSVDWHRVASDQTRYRPQGPSHGEAKVIRGGSYLCHASYCNRYRLSSRSHNTPASSTGHMGFRCVLE